MISITTTWHATVGIGSGLDAIVDNRVSAVAFISVFHTGEVESKSHASSDASGRCVVGAAGDAGAQDTTVGVVTIQNCQYRYLEVLN
jgi:hypothetical protein